MADKMASGMVEPVRFGNGIDAFRAFPEAKGRQPAVIILHERYGRVDRMSMDWSLFRGPEAREGMRAFAEKRPPRWVPKQDG